MYGLAASPWRQRRPWQCSAPGRLHGEALRWNRASERIMAAPLGRDTLPEHWSYGVCRDGRVFFVKWVGLKRVNDAVSRGLTWVSGVCRCVFPPFMSPRRCNRCFSSPLLSVRAAAMRRGAPPGCIPAPVSRSTPDTWSAQVSRAKLVPWSIFTCCYHFVDFQSLEPGELNFKLLFFYLIFYSRPTLGMGGRFYRRRGQLLH